jgi:hypothetical protein
MCNNIFVKLNTDITSKKIKEIKVNAILQSKYNKIYYVTIIYFNNNSEDYRLKEKYYFEYIKYININ